MYTEIIKLIKYFIKILKQKYVKCLIKKYMKNMKWHNKNYNKCKIKKKLKKLIIILYKI